MHIYCVVCAEFGTSLFCVYPVMRDCRVLRNIYVKILIMMSLHYAIWPRGLFQLAHFNSFYVEIIWWFVRWWRIAPITSNTAKILFEWEHNWNYDASCDIFHCTIKLIHRYSWSDVMACHGEPQSSSSQWIDDKCQPDSEWVRRACTLHIGFHALWCRTIRFMTTTLTKTNK